MTFEKCYNQVDKGVYKPTNIFTREQIIEAIYQCTTLTYSEATYVVDVALKRIHEGKYRDYDSIMEITIDYYNHNGL